MYTGKYRIRWVDAFRAIMILFIAFGHATKTGALKQYVYSFHVAAFFFVSGYLFKTSKLTFKQFAWKKFKSLMVPYYVFSIISIFIFSVLGSFASEKLEVAIKTSDIPRNLIGMLWANGSTGYMKWNLPLWFIPCLYGMELVGYLFVNWINRNCRNRMRAYLVIGTFAIVVAIFSYKALQRYALPFQFETLIFMLAFFAMGLMFKEHGISSNSIKPIIGLIFIIIGYIIAVYGNTSVDYVTSKYGDIRVFYIAAVISIIGYVGIAGLFNSRFLSYIGQNTLPILLMHKFPIVALQIVFGAFIEQTSFTSIIIAILITVISCAACFIVDIPLRRYMPFIYGGRVKRQLDI